MHLQRIRRNLIDEAMCDHEQFIYNARSHLVMSRRCQWCRRNLPVFGFICHVNARRMRATGMRCCGLTICVDCYNNRR
jgi:hypothetical protein